MEVLIVRRLLLAAFLALGLVLPAAGCYERPTCSFACDPAAPVCPYEYACAPDGRCKLKGTSPAYQCPADDGRADAARPDAAAADAGQDAAIQDAAAQDAAAQDAALEDAAPPLDAAFDDAGGGD
jgi:hypothetical protein